MEALDFEGLIEHFSSKVNRLKLLMCMTQASTTQLGDVQEMVKDLKLYMDSLKGWLDVGKSDVERAKESLKCIKLLQQRVECISEFKRLPAQKSTLEVPVQAQHNGKPTRRIIDFGLSDGSNINIVPPQPTLTFERFVGDYNYNPFDEPSRSLLSNEDMGLSRRKSMSMPSLAMKSNGVANFDNLTLVDHLTENEFETVPKYMKGRLLLSAVNKLVDTFNRALQTKYKLKSKSVKISTDGDKRHQRKYKEQEIDETKRVHFVIDEDLRECGCSLDKNALSMLVILRHCNRLKEIRGGKLTRYGTIE